jgi:hypothetical protein
MTIKTASIELFKPIPATTLALVIVSGLFVCTPRAQGNTVIFTENSSTSLTVVENGKTLPSKDVINTSADNWTITLPTAVSVPEGSVVNWREPLTSPFPKNFNLVDWFSSTHLEVQSDLANVPGRQLHNGDTFVNGADSYTFHDNSDVPDSGSTFNLLALALAGLFGATGLRSRQLV